MNLFSSVPTPRNGQNFRILIACEESQTVCKAFRAKGFEAYSCDILPCSGGKPEWHIQGDALETAYNPSYAWDVMIAFPPCTHLAVSGARWFKEGVKPYSLQDEGAAFFMAIANAPIGMIAIENPICVMSTKYRKPNQVIHPWQFGHPEQKKTCLWLKNLPEIVPTKNVHKYMMTLPLKDRTRIHWLGSGKSKERSVTFSGIAEAMATQWGRFLTT